MQQTPDLPEEYLQQLQSLTRRRELARALSQQAMAPQQLQMVGPFAVGQSRTGAIARALSGLGGGFIDRQVGGEMDNLLQRAASERQRETADVMGMQDPKAQIAAAMASRFPSLRKQGEELRKQHGERVRAAASAASTGGDTMGAVSMLRGDAIPTNYSLTPPPEPTFGTTPTGRGYVQTRNKFGEPTVKLEDKGTTLSVDARVIPNEEKASLDYIEGQLKERQPKADVAVRALDSMRAAVEAAELGARAGGGQSAIQALRKVGQAFGMDLSNVSQVDALRSALGQGVLEYARKLAPVTQNDVTMLERIMGSIDTDPAALTKMLARTTAIQMRELANYDKFLSSQEATLTSPTARARLAGARVGYDEPGRLFGPTSFQIELAKQLIDNGFDPKRLQGLPPGVLEDLMKGARTSFDIFQTPDLVRTRPQPAQPALPEGMREVPRPPGRRG